MILERFWDGAAGPCACFAAEVDRNAALALDTIVTSRLYPDWDCFSALISMSSVDWGDPLFLEVLAIKCGLRHLAMSFVTIEVFRRSGKLFPW